MCIKKVFFYVVPCQPKIKHIFMVLEKYLSLIPCKINLLVGGQGKY